MPANGGVGPANSALMHANDGGGPPNSALMHANEVPASSALMHANDGGGPASSALTQANDGVGLANSVLAQANDSVGQAKDVFNSIGEIAEKDKHTWGLLQFSTWLDINFIPRSLIIVLSGTIAVRVSVKRLVDRSLITIIEEDGGGNEIKGIKVNGAVRDEIVNYMEKNPVKSKDSNVLVTELLEGIKEWWLLRQPPDEAREADEVYVRHAEAVLNHARAIGFSNQDAIDIGNNLAVVPGILRAHDARGNGNAAQQEEEKEFRGGGTLSYAVNSYPEYYNGGIDQMLELRIASFGFGSDLSIKLLKSRLFTKELSCSVSQMANDVAVAFESGNEQVILAPFNLYNEHWLGLLFRKLGAFVEVTYLDSEQEALLPKIREGLEVGLSVNGYGSKFSELRLEMQRYNNCGPELLENFVYCLTGNRATQEGTLYVHSLLSENSLLDPAEYGLQIQENSKLIGFLSNAAPLSIQSIYVTTNAKTLRFVSFEEQASHLSHVTKEGISLRAVDGEVALNLLPAIKQFNSFWAKWLQDKLHQVNSVVYKTNVWFKGLDLAVDSARLIYQPNLYLVT